MDFLFKRSALFVILLLPLSTAIADSNLNARGQAFLNQYAKQINYVPNTSHYNVLSSHNNVKIHNLDTFLDFANIFSFNFNSQDGRTGFDEASWYPVVNLHFNNHLTLASLFEISINNSGNTPSYIKYLELDWTVNPNLMLVSGVFVSPLGKFSNSLYLPWQNKLPTDPIGFDIDEANPIEDIGFQLRGSTPISLFDNVNYALFVSASPYVHTADNNFDSISTNGSPSNRGGKKIVGSRIGLFVTPSFEVGISAAAGSVELFNNGIKIDNSRNYSANGIDLNYIKNNFDLRAEYIQQFIASHSTSFIPNSAKWKAMYTQAAYRFNSPWEAILRWGYFSSPVTEDKQHQFAMGIDYWFTSSKVAKLYYAFNHGQSGSLSNANEAVLQFVFDI